MKPFPIPTLNRRRLALQEWVLARVDSLGTRMGRNDRFAPHLATGLRGERAALFHLRRLGYIVVAQRWTNAKVRGDLDLIAWDERETDGQPWLCFIEVKTRSARDLSPAESAVDHDKQRTLRSLARAYLRAFPEEKRHLIPVRFDVVSVYLLENGAEFEVFEGGVRMALTYAKPTSPGSVDPSQLAIRLAEVVGEAVSWLEELSEERTSMAPAEGKWCAKEVIGHLVDSAVNNLQRIVRLETVLDVEPDVRTQPYEQDEWVRAQHYKNKNWMQLLTLWIVLNEHIAWTMRHLPRTHLSRLCVFPDTHMTFGFLMADYIAHMEHHLNALKTWLESSSDSSVTGV